LTRSNVPTLDGQAGRFTCVKAGAANHGPVAVSGTFHFAYADGRPYYPIGTTCYGWSHQSDALEEQTLAALRQSPFNKMRMLLFPHYARDMIAPRSWQTPKPALPGFLRPPKGSKRWI
jgi:hypothetical protein